MLCLCGREGDQDIRLCTMEWTEKLQNVNVTAEYVSQLSQGFTAADTDSFFTLVLADTSPE